MKTKIITAVIVAMLSAALAFGDSEQVSRRTARTTKQGDRELREMYRMTESMERMIDAMEDFNKVFFRQQYYSPRMQGHLFELLEEYAYRTQAWYDFETAREYIGKFDF